MQPNTLEKFFYQINSQYSNQFTGHLRIVGSNTSPISVKKNYNTQVIQFI